MTKLTPEESIRIDLDYINTRKQKLKEYEKNIQANKLKTFGMMSQSIAKEYLLLDNVDEARKWFAESANYYLESKEINDTRGDSNFTYSSGLSLLKSASLSGNKKLEQEAIESILKKNPYTNPPGLFLKFQVIVCNLTLGNDDINEEIQELKTLEDKYSKKTGGYYIGYADSLKALQTMDSEKLLENVEQILSGFSRSSLRRDYSYELITTMLLLLGKKRGMDIDPEKDLDNKFYKYIPMNLLTVMLNRIKSVHGRS